MHGFACLCPPVCIYLKKVDSQQTKRQLYYDQVIEFYQKTGYSAYKIEKLGIVPLKRKAIHNWIVNFVAENGKITSQTSMQSKESQTNEELDALKAEVAELKEQLRIEKLRETAQPPEREDY